MGRPCDVDIVIKSMKLREYQLKAVVADKYLSEICLALRKSRRIVNRFHKQSIIIILHGLSRIVVL